MPTVASKHGDPVGAQKFAARMPDRDVDPEVRHGERLFTGQLVMKHMMGGFPGHLCTVARIAEDPWGSPRMRGTGDDHQ
jgi:hypothetical protein